MMKQLKIALGLVLGILIPITGFCDGTGVFVSGNGDVMTNRHVVNDVVKEPATKFYVGYKGVFYPATVTSISGKTDLALLHIDKKTPCLAVSKHEIKSGDKLKALMFNLLSLDYQDFDNKREIFNITVHGTDSVVLGQKAFEFEAVLRPGNSGSPILDDDGDIVAVGFAGLQGGGFFITSYGLMNEAVKDFADNNKQVSCTFPDTGSTMRDNLVWIYEVQPAPQIAITVVPVPPTETTSIAPMPKMFINNDAILNGWELA
jgi:hypothetical protein